MREREVSMSLSHAAPLIAEVAKGGGVFSLRAQGVSMHPTLRGGLDIMKLGRLDEPQKYDIVLYRRESGEYVLHRIVGIDGDSYTMCGDAQISLEYGVTRQMMLARLVSVVRQGKEIPTVGAKNVRQGRYIAFLRVLRRGRHSLRKLFEK